MLPRLWKTVRDCRGRRHQSTRCTWQSIGCKRPFIAWIPARTVSGGQGHNTSFKPSKFPNCQIAILMVLVAVLMLRYNMAALRQFTRFVQAAALGFRHSRPCHCFGLLGPCKRKELWQHCLQSPCQQIHGEKPAFHFGKILCLPFKRRRISTLDPM